MTLFSKRLISQSNTITLGLLFVSLLTTSTEAQQQVQPVSPVPVQQRTQNRAKRAPFKLSPIKSVGFQDVERAVRVDGAVEGDAIQPRSGFQQGPVAIAPMGKTYTPEEVHGDVRLQNQGPKDEYLIDGSDRNFRAYVDEDWKVHGLDAEDTIGHFDTLDGRRIAAPSNRVAIYAPRFATVRRVSDVNGRSYTAQLASAKEKMQTSTAQFEDLTSTTMQNMQPQRHKTTRRPVAFLDRTRGVVNETVLHMAGLSTGFKAYENTQLIKWGRVERSEGTRLNIALQSANAWTDNLRVLVDSKTTNLIMVNDVAAAQDIKVSETKGANPTLRVAKVASRITAKPGDEVDFTIRFDNVGNQVIGNVTIIDNLTSRLEYIADSAECSVEGNLVMTENEVGSVTLRWEFNDPLAIGKGGVIRFKCRVR
jgi:uncharacterized repeat protein (TIGR01451 family)